MLLGVGLIVFALPSLDESEPATAPVPTVHLTAANVTDGTATLVIANRSGAWRYKRDISPLEGA